MRAIREKLRDLWRARELLRQLVAKELKVRYKGSVLGFLWSLLTPLLMTAVFTVVFGFLLRIQVDDFAAFFIAGYLAWQFLTNSVQGSIQTIVGNGSLIRKVYFPREVLPLAIVLAQAIHFLLALLAVIPFLVWQRGAGVLLYLPSVVLGVVLLTIFTSGLSMLFAGANVGFRDLQELIVVFFLVWFYATPVIYPYQFVAERAGSSDVMRVFSGLIDANPMTWFVRLFRLPLYGDASGTGGTATGPVWPDATTIGITAGAALVVFAVGYVLFHRFALTFAKEV